jgi:hypothetical protein
MAEPQIPRVNDLLGAGFNAIVEERPSVAAQLAFGRYGNVMHGWKAQAQLVLRRLAAEAVSTRLISEGRPLLDLLASEFDAIIDPSPQKALGTVRLRRNKPALVDFTGGLIPTGTKFRRPADATASPPAQEALYESTEPVYVGTDATVTPPLTGYTQRITVPIQAARPGSHANIVRQYSPLTTDETDPPIELADTLFDTFTVIYGDAAGGSDGPPTAKLRSLGRALGSGQYGPNEAAILAGLLSTVGVAHAAMRENTSTGKVIAWIADESWAWSSRLRDLSLQNLNDSWLGFGCSAGIGLTSVIPAAVVVAAKVRDTRSLAESSGLTSRMRTAIKSYFEDRSDWYTWNANGIRGAVMRSDRRLLDVTSVVVKDLAGNTLSEPATSLPTTTINPLVYRYVSDTNITITLASPS